MYYFYIIYLIIFFFNEDSIRIYVIFVLNFSHLITIRKELKGIYKV